MAFVAVLVLAPLPLGSNRPWAWSLLALAIGALLVLYAGAVAFGVRRQEMRLSRFLPLALPWCAVIAWGLVQATWPIQAHSGATWVWQSAAGTLGAGMQPRISVEPSATINACLLLAVYGAAFFLSAQLTSEPRDRLFLLRSLFAAAVVYALFGIANHLLTGSTQIFFYERLRTGGERFGVSSTFVYQNAYAIYATLGVMVAITLLFRKFDGQEDRSAGIAEFLLGEGGRQMAVVAGLFLVLASAVASGSRGVLVTATGATLVLIAICARSSAPSRRWWLWGTVAAALVAALSIAGGQVLERTLAMEHGIMARRLLYQEVIEALRQSPWVGWGFGTYRVVNRIFFGPDQLYVFNQAHSTVLEAAVDLGIPMAVVFLFPFPVLAWIFLRGLMQRRRGRRYFGLGLATLALVSLQGALDFTLQMPAVAVTVSALLGLVFASATRRENEDHLPARATLSRAASGDDTR